MILVEEELTNMVGVEELALSFESPLTNAGGTINIEPYPAGFSVQGTCNDVSCNGISSPFDFPTAGRVTTTAPIPTLSLSVSATSISENGGVTNAVVSRNGFAGSLTVNLSSSDPGEATVPATIVIADGEVESAPFNITAVDDGILDGTQSVTVTASATGYTGDTANISVVPECVSASVTNFNEFTNALTFYSASCDDGDTLEIDLNGQTIVYAADTSSINNASSAVLSISNGTLDANSEGYVMRVYDGHVEFENTLLTGGAGLDGGAIQLRPGAEATLVNTTVTGNTSGSAGAIFNDQGTLTLTHVTISDNQVSAVTSDRGAVWNRSASNSATLNLNNSIIANTYDPSGTPVADCANEGGSVNLSMGQSNLLEQDSLGLWSCSPNSAKVISADPRLSSLADNGGSSRTMAPYVTSPVLDTGDNTVAVGLLTDQRGTGFTRLLGSRPDLGAFEGATPAPVRTVNLSLTANTASEALTNSITVTATASDFVYGDQTVDLTVSGVGISPTDYTLNTEIVIPDGQTSGSTTFTVLNDSLVEGLESATLTLTNPSTGVLLGTTVSQNIAISDDDYAQFSIATTSNAIEPSTHGLFTVSSTHPLPSPALVSMTITGTATEGVDFATIGGSFVFPTGTTTVTIPVNVIADAIVEVNETIIVTLTNTDKSFALIGAENSATVVIENVPESLQLSLDAASITEGGSVTGTVIRENTSLSDALIVHLSSSHPDRLMVSATVTIPASQASTQFTVSGIDNLLVDADINATITAGATGFQGAESMLVLFNDDFDSDNDLLLDRFDNCPYTANPDQSDFESDGLGDACDTDDDGDGMPDEFELAHGLNPRNSFDRDADVDRDGFTNFQEYEFRTDPNTADSDDNNNGIPDNAENRPTFITPLIQLLLSY
ncbi:hypothetical protein GCM10008090_17230 [Arenicella chitinivorans]|uniref:Calx-beta domain-containing protein n=2 Tax=Arenicella chitinivorans TaxID=1329800 RepID=A0A918VLF1_9GAMM|nr:hypothetical protein GCM10008090_17230 [Arenicella chitinivorans]